MEVNDKLFKNYGEWKSEKVKDGTLIKQSTEVKLIVTKIPGL